MAWQATLVAPSPDTAVTVIVRVTYYSLEALCREPAFTPDEASLN